MRCTSASNAWSLGSYRTMPTVETFTTLFSWNDLQFFHARRRLFLPLRMRNRRRFSRKVYKSENSITINTYLEYPSARLRATVFTKLHDVFLAALPAHNPLSSSVALTQRLKKDYTKTLVKFCDYYSSHGHNPALVSVSKTELRKGITARTSAHNNVLQFKAYFVLLVFPETRPDGASLYLLAFHILKASTLFYYIFILFLRVTSIHVIITTQNISVVVGPGFKIRTKDRG